MMKQIFKIHTSYFLAHFWILKFFLFSLSFFNIFFFFYSNLNLIEIFLSNSIIVFCFLAFFYYIKKSFAIMLYFFYLDFIILVIFCFYNQFLFQLFQLYNSSVYISIFFIFIFNLFFTSPIKRQIKLYLNNKRHIFLQLEHSTFWALVCLKNQPTLNALKQIPITKTSHIDLSEDIFTEYSNIKNNVIKRQEFLFTLREADKLMFSDNSLKYLWNKTSKECSEYLDYKDPSGNTQITSLFQQYDVISHCKEYKLLKNTILTPKLKIPSVTPDAIDMKNTSIEVLHSIFIKRHFSPSQLNFFNTYETTPFLDIKSKFTDLNKLSNLLVLDKVTWANSCVYKNLWDMFLRLEDLNLKKIRFEDKVLIYCPERQEIFKSIGSEIFKDNIQITSLESTLTKITIQITTNL